MAGYDWITPAVGLLGGLIGTVVTYAISRRTLRQQKELPDQQWQRQLDQARRQKEDAERDTSSRQEAQVKSDDDRYRDWVISQYRFLNITGLRTRAPVEVDLERVYVSLGVDARAITQFGDGDETASRPGAEDLALLVRQREHASITIAEALQTIDHNRIAGLVILGGPGTGKTTVLRYLALSYARGLQGERFDQPRSRLPLFVPLRTLVAESPPPLADYMTQWCLQAGCKVSPAFFDDMLKSGQCLVLLDGLDEVADAAQRRAVSRWIAQQSVAYGHNPFVITCRPAGFREDFLPPRFLRLDIQDFDETDVEAFARNWCLAVETMLRGDSDTARQKAESDGTDLIQAIQGNERVKALAVNPLMLSIIALVHRYRARLPDRRVDLYSECVEVLLGHWDEAKDLAVDIPPTKALQVLQPLALWMHEHKSGESQRLARCEEIEPVIAPHLAGIGFAEAGAARAFLNSIRDRSGLLVEHGPDMFGFQHQTFQEFLTAKEIVAHRREALLSEHFGDGYWQEVTLLYAGLHDTTALLQDILALPDAHLMQHWARVCQVRDEALYVDDRTRQAISAHPFTVLRRASEAVTAGRAAIHARSQMPELDALIEAFDAADDCLIKGHLALLLSETGDMRAAEVLQPHLTHPEPHVRYVVALALAILGTETPQILDDLLMVRIPAGEFTMGSDKGDEDEKPVRRIATGAFALDRFPLTNGQFRHFVDAGGYEERRYWPDQGWQWKEENNIAQPIAWDYPQYMRPSSPVVALSFYEAQAYANWAGKRLPTEQEWERAARGDEDAREYPWGDTYEARRANADGEIDGPTPVGSFPDGVSPHGCYDMAGNVWEWTASLYREGSSERVLRGGAWLDRRDRARCSVRRWLGPHDGSVNIGVRLSRTL